MEALSRSLYPIFYPPRWEVPRLGSRIAIRDSEYDDSFIALILAENSDKHKSHPRIHNKFKAHGNTKTVAHGNTKTVMMTSTLHKIWSCQPQAALFMSCFCWSSFSFSWHRFEKNGGNFPRIKAAKCWDKLWNRYPNHYHLEVERWFTSFTILYLHQGFITIQKEAPFFENGGNDFQGIIGFFGKFLSDNMRDTSATMHTLR